WLDIAGVGTRLAITSDDQTVQFNLPTAFGPFYFYGRRFSQLSVCGNGWVGPGYTTRTAYSNISIPASNTATMLALVWDDLYPPTSGGVWWHHDAANRRLIVQYDSMPYYSSRNVYEWFQVVIYDTTLAAPDGNSVFTYQYLTANGYGSSTTGINDSTTAVGIECLFNGVYHRGSAPIVPGMAIRFTTVGPTVGVAEVASGRLPARLGLGFLGPNPARRYARVGYALPRAADARLTVYDASGRRVRELASGLHQAGEHVAAWDGRDDSGREVARGVYVCRLEVGGESAARKLVLVE
ncbi:MAG: FlgD immunoglobulin-like domain containing protein, partial [bacterium]